MSDRPLGCQIGLWARERAVKSYSRATRRGGGSCQLVYRHETPSARSSWRPPAARFWELLGAKGGGRIKFRPRAAHHSKSAPIRGIRRQGKPPPFLGRDNYLRRGAPSFWPALLPRPLRPSVRIGGVASGWRYRVAAQRRCVANWIARVWQSGVAPTRKGVLPGSTTCSGAVGRVDCPRR